MHLPKILQTEGTQIKTWNEAQVYIILKQCCSDKTVTTFSL